jgi:hypothetical protein
LIPPKATVDWSIVGKIEDSSAANARWERSRRRWSRLRVALALVAGLACPIFVTINGEGGLTPKRYWPVSQALWQVLGTVTDQYVPAAVTVFLGFVYLLQYLLYVLVLVAILAAVVGSYRRFASQ